MSSNIIMPTLEQLQNMIHNGSEDFLRHALTSMLNLMMELEVSEKNKAAKYERTSERKSYRNGTRPRKLDTGVGELILSVPKLRHGESYYPAFLEQRRMIDQAFVSVIQEAYINGVSTRKVDKLVEELGIQIDKSKVSRLCKELDEQVLLFKNRPIIGEYPYVWVDATYLKVRENKSVQSMAFVVCIGVDVDGNRHVLGFDIGTAENEGYWTEFLSSLVNRGLSGVKLVISDAHTGLKKAILKTFTGSTWQRCRVHAMRNILCHVPKKQQPMVSAMIRSIFAETTLEECRNQAKIVMNTLENKFPKAMSVLEEALEDVLAYMNYPKEHHRQLHSTNPLERLNKEIKRRANVVSIFPNRESVIRLVGALLMEQQDEWIASDRRYMSLESMTKLKSTSELLISTAISD